MVRSRGQSAMEFLMTYGWAILIMLVVIGVLFYIGVFRPQSSIPKSCTLPAGFSCYEYLIDSTGMLHLDLGQAMGRRVTITGINCSTNGSAGAATPPDGQVSIENGHHKKVTGPAGLQCDITPGSTTYRGKLIITYKMYGSNLSSDHLVIGDISGPIEGAVEGGGVPTVPPVTTYAYSGTTYYYNTDTSGGTLTGANILLQRYEGGSYSDVSDGSGDYAIDVPAGNYTIRVTAAGYDELLTSTWVLITGALSGQDYTMNQTYGDGTAPGTTCILNADCSSRVCQSACAPANVLCYSGSSYVACGSNCCVCDGDGDCPTGQSCDSAKICVPDTP